MGAIVLVVEENWRLMEASLLLAVVACVSKREWTWGNSLTVL